jgi:hypothetical protein
MTYVSFGINFNTMKSQHLVLNSRCIVIKTNPAFAAEGRKSSLIDLLNQT